MSTLIAISGLGILCLILEIFNMRKVLVPVTLLGLAAVLGFNIAEIALGNNIFEIESYGMIHETGYSKGFSVLFVILLFFILLMSPKFYESRIAKISDYVSLKVFLTAGAVAMVSFGNFVMFFVGLEVLSIAAYVLASSKPDNLSSNEAGMKYFLMGAVASSFVLFGLALIYGATASFNMAAIAEALVANNLVSSTWMMLGLIMVSLGMFFKASIFPFHFWAPDVYQGSPTITTALMSTLVKVAAIGSFFYIISGLSVAMSETMIWVVIALSILTMTVANITALRQTNIKRMMAYSGISHAGFMIMTLIVAPEGGNTVLYYAAAYSFAGLAAFGVIMAVCKDKGNEEISNFYGLFNRKPLLAVVLVAALMSLGGVPIFAGFFAKFFLFREMLSNGYLLLVIAGVVNSIIAIYYYFGVINVMFTKESESKETLNVPIVYTIAAVGAIALNVIIGLAPSLLMSFSLQ